MREAKWYVRPVYAVVILALILSVGITALPLTATVEANECSQNVWVDDTGPSCPDTGNGTQADPYCTIQDGVNHVCAGGTVHVLPGKYDGGIAVNKTGVTIESTDGPEVTVVDPISTNGFVVTEQGVTIDGFTITGFGGGMTGPAPEDTGDSFGNPYTGCGIVLAGVSSADNCTIQNNIIENNFDGILILTNNNEILYNNILNNVESFSGIHIRPGASGNEIHCNNIMGNLGYGVIKEEENDVHGVLGLNRESVDATKNYWGCSEGPGAAGCDPVSDNVLFNPYLRRPFEQCEECGGTPPSPSPMVPAVDQWGMVAMMSLFAGFLVWTVWRRRPAL
jgi:parallel beta-helix repeat protein